jgi:hypothetical protein
MSNETITKCLNGTTNDIELDLLLAKTTTLSSSVSLLNQLVNISSLNLNHQIVGFDLLD